MPYDNIPYKKKMGMPEEYAPAMEMPTEYAPMMNMPKEELEAMYPKTYQIIYPHVKQHCDMCDAQFGTEYTPTREHVEAMVDDIQRKVEPEIEVEIGEVERQPFFGRRRLARDLISVLLIRQLLGRRRPFYGYPGSFGYPGYGYPGYFGGGYGGYPGGFGGYGAY